MKRANFAARNRHHLEAEIVQATERAERCRDAVLALRAIFLGSGELQAVEPVSNAAPAFRRILHGEGPDQPSGEDLDGMVEILARRLTSRIERANLTKDDEGVAQRAIPATSRMSLRNALHAQFEAGIA